MFSGNAGVVFGVAMVGLLIYGTDAGKLGLYWDDSSLLLHALHKADGDVMRFILNDASHFLSSERPLAYFAHMLCRAGFAVSLPFAHWISVVFMALNAVVVTIVARRIIDRKWFAFAAGAVFLIYPMAPLQAIWPTLLQYLWASLLMLLAIWSFLRGLETGANKQVRYFVFAAFLYVAGIITHETFILLPPIFVCFYVVSMGGSDRLSWKFLGPVRISRSAASCLGLFLIAMAAYTAWREITLPSYGGQLYPTSSTTLQEPPILTGKFLTGVEIFFVPLDEMIQQLLQSPPAPRYVFLSAILFLAVWAIVVRLRWLENREQEAQIIPWHHAATCGFALAMGGIAILALSPAWIAGVVGTGFYSRVNFVLVMGVALAVPAVIGLLVSPSNRFSPFAGLSSIVFLFYVGFNSSYLDFAQLYPLSNSAVVLGAYSLKHQLMIFGYLMGVALVILVVSWSSLLSVRQLMKLPISDRLNGLWLHISTQFVAGTVACLVLFGSLFHFSIKQEYIAKWNEHKSLLAQLQRLAPALKENTFVVMVRDPNDPVSPSHYELSSFLVAVYGDRSIKGNTNWQLRFYPDGVKSTYYGKRVGRDNDRISYDRLLIFVFDGRKLRVLPQIEVTTEDGKPLVVRNHPDRILSGPAVTTVVSRYLK